MASAGKMYEANFMARAKTLVARSPQNSAPTILTQMQQSALPPAQAPPSAARRHTPTLVTFVHRVPVGMSIEELEAAEQERVCCGPPFTQKFLEKGVSPLHLAAASAGRNDAQLVELLIDAGADVDAADGEAGEAPVFFAIRGDSLPALKVCNTYI